jgi:hypothetical protein
MKQIIKYLKILLKCVAEFRRNETVYMRETIEMKKKIDVLLIVNNEMAKKVDEDYAKHVQLNNTEQSEFRVIGFQPSSIRAKATDSVPNSIQQL